MVLRRFGWVPSVGLALALSVWGCGSADGSTDGDGGAGGGVRARFAPAEHPMDFGAIPWPDGLYRDVSGRVRVGALPGRDRAPGPQYLDALSDSLADLDGFGALPTIYFWFDGALDPDSLPASPGASASEGASVFLIDVDPASPGAFQRVPVDVWWHDERQRLALRPADGHPLVGGRRYAAVVTRSVDGEDGRAVSPASVFARVRDADTRPADERLAEAYDHYAPVLSSLATNGIPRERVAAMALFRVQSLAGDLQDARGHVWAREPPAATLVEALRAGEQLDAALGTPSEEGPGVDTEGGAPHDAIGWMIHARFDAPHFLSDRPGVHGAFTRDEDRALQVKGTASVPFTLWLPRGAELEALRVALFLHGLGGERSEALGVADALAEAGWAVLAIDAPFHGLRSPQSEVDATNRFTGESRPDGFGDVPKDVALRDFAGVEDDGGSLVPFHPVYLRDALRQTVVELFAALRLVRDGDWSGVQTASEELGSVGFAAAPLLYIGHSLGGMVGVPFAALEPEVGSAVLATAGGDLTQLLGQGPLLKQVWLDPLLRQLGEDPSELDYKRPPTVLPQLSIWQTLLDRGDPLMYGRPLRRSPTNVLLMMARDDETVANVGTEALAGASDAVIVEAEPRYVELEGDRAPVRSNRTVEGQPVTRALTVFGPATHDLLVRRRGEQRYRHPLEPPFERIEPRTVSNPNAAAVEQLLHFVESWRGGAAEVTAAVE